MGLAETKQRILGCLDGGRIEIIWPDDIDLGGRIVSRIGIKLLMNMVMLGTDLLPGTGCVSVSFDPSESAFHAMVLPSLMWTGLLSPAFFLLRNSHRER